MQTGILSNPSHLLLFRSFIHANTSFLVMDNQLAFAIVDNIWDNPGLVSIEDNLIVKVLTTINGLYSMYTLEDS